MERMKYLEMGFSNRIRSDVTSKDRRGRSNFTWNRIAEKDYRHQGRQRKKE